MLYKENAVGYKAYIILYLHMLSKNQRLITTTDISCYEKN